MNLPTWALMYLPSKMQEKQIQKHWDSKSNGDIMDAYQDSTEWIKNSKSMPCDALDKIATSCNEKLDKYILPQMEKREIMCKELIKQ